ncbi:mercuric transporter MerT family protein [Sulfurospirillum arcachonense]|uniref:mercuric transporter MerT family protein n=1 Tax=Sulfurospirillum arcachonense TaxID=57666 RepID=UPI0004683C56|nr:mercuric transporter MerT family protein [Sulfurospirillum arcachonense]
MKEDNSFFTLIGSAIMAAFLASSCCLAPLLFLVFGISVSSLSFLQVLAPYKWVFSLVSIAVIVYLWYQFLKKDNFTCNSKTCNNYKLYLIIGTLFVSIFISYPYWFNYIVEYL